MKTKLFWAAIFFNLCSTANAAEFDLGIDVDPRSSSCIKNTPCIVASSHWASIVNHTTQAKNFFVVYKICPQNEDCRTDTYKIKVNPGTWSDGKIMTTQAKYHYVGDFILRAETTITDETRRPIKNIQKQGKIQVHG